MKKFSSQQLRIIRIFTIIIGMLISFIIWLFLPDVLTNNALFHVGNGKTGSKWGALLLVLIPLFGFIPGRMEEEIQLAVALLCSVVACLVMLCGLVLC